MGAKRGFFRRFVKEVAKVTEGAFVFNSCTEEVGFFLLDLLVSSFTEYLTKLRNPAQSELFDQLTKCSHFLFKDPQKRTFWLNTISEKFSQNKNSKQNTKSEPDKITDELIRERKWEMNQMRPEPDWLREKTLLPEELRRIRFLRNKQFTAKLFKCLEMLLKLGINFISANWAPGLLENFGRLVREFLRVFLSAFLSFPGI